jgi:hypothetical protein
MGRSVYGIPVREAHFANLSKPFRSIGFVVLAAVVTASMWFYVNGILRAHQIADANVRQVPRGNLSDLYPRWWGTRELLLHHRNPYGRDVTLEIQEGYYGRRLDPARPNDPQDQEGFAYPVYVVFLLAPLVWVPFPALLVAFYWLLIISTAISVHLWLRVLKWPLGATDIVVCVTLTLGSFAAVQGIKLQQLSLLVAALMAGAVACAAGGHLFIGGALLALATIKPQLAWALAAWLLFWAVSDWRNRRRFVLGFAIVMVLLLGGAEIVLPGWVGMFIDAVRRYHGYTQNRSVLDELVPWASAGKILAVVAAVASATVLWRQRSVINSAAGFAQATALVLALTVLVVPMYAPYNQVLLLPAILVLVRDRAIFFLRSPGVRFLYLSGAVALAWQWIASLSLSAASLFVSRTWALNRWQWPFLATFALPVVVFALILLDTVFLGKPGNLGRSQT